jgi:hypothetical protein
MNRSFWQKCSDHYLKTSGFWPRVRARARTLKHAQQGAARPPAHRSSAASYLPPKAFPQARALPPGASIFQLRKAAPY